ncbi:MAG: DUF4405 domain-containing protein [Pirellulales bacterium]|nr:DUF4405 domain-containing protein [Pirellulales bacterium]
MRRQLRSFTSLVLAAAFVVVAFSGAILYCSPKGRVAHWTGWTMLGLEKEEWSGLHINFALLFLLAGGLHWFLNWDLFWSYLRSKQGRRWNYAGQMTAIAAIAAVFLAGTLLWFPPFSTILWGNAQLQDYWELHSPRPPAPHAEEFRLRRFANTIGLSLDDLKDALRKEGYVVESDFMTVRQLAEQRNGVPSDVLAAVQKHFPTAGSKPPGCQGKGGSRAAP